MVNDKDIRAAAEKLITNLHSIFGRQQCIDLTEQAIRDEVERAEDDLIDWIDDRGFIGCEVDWLKKYRNRSRQGGA